MGKLIFCIVACGLEIHHKPLLLFDLIFHPRPSPTHFCQPAHGAGRRARANNVIMGSTLARSSTYGWYPRMFAEDLRLLVSTRDHVGRFEVILFLVLFHKKRLQHFQEGAQIFWVHSFTFRMVASFQPTLGICSCFYLAQHGEHDNRNKCYIKVGQIFGKSQWNFSANTDVQQKLLVILHFCVKESAAKMDQKY